MRLHVEEDKSQNTFFFLRKPWHICASSFFGNESNIEAKLLTSNDSFLIYSFVRSWLMKQSHSTNLSNPYSLFQSLLILIMYTWWREESSCLKTGIKQYCKNEKKPWLLNSCTKTWNIYHCLKTSRKYWPGLVKTASIALLSTNCFDSASSKAI